MSIRNKLSLLFTLLTAAILLAFAGTVYYSAQKNREKEFYNLLRKEAITKANLFFEAKTEAKILQSIYKNNRKNIREIEVAIYDNDFSLLYHDAVEIDFVKENQQMLNAILSEGQIQFYQEAWQVVGLQYKHEGKTYLITATAYDEYGYTKLRFLLRDMTLIFVASVMFIYIIGPYLAFKALEPVQEITHKVKQITATNLDLRLPRSQNQDEISQLAHTFNEMLDRLENSFDAQKHLVTNISHELRTPLAALVAELELTLSKDRYPEEYRKALNNVLNDTNKLVRLTNSLLNLAKASYDATEIKFKPIRIDEILLDACWQVQKINPNYKTEIIFEQEVEDENQITIHGNEYLLQVAFSNLLENGCKFSPNTSVKVLISFNSSKNPLYSRIHLSFTDEGIGISEEDLQKIFKPFYRGENKSFAEGSGVGIFLTQKIIQLHNGTIDILSQKNQGTSVLVSLPHL